MLNCDYIGTTIFNVFIHKLLTSTTHLLLCIFINLSDVSNYQNIYLTKFHFRQHYVKKGRKRTENTKKNNKLGQENRQSSEKTLVTLYNINSLRLRHNYNIVIM